jgi:hypothetical protein
MKKRDYILVIGAIAFLALVICLVLLLGNKLDVDKQICGCPKVISHNFVWIFIILAVAFVACLLYYLFSLRMETQNKVIDRNMEILYTILDEDEKKVIKKLVDNKGELLQNDIAKMFGDKIRAHRVIKKLEDKKMIDINKNGKGNTIKLKSELRKEMKR